MIDKNNRLTLDAKAATAVAKNPGTSSRRLAAIAGVSKDVDRLLAAHPNASAALLEKLSHSDDTATCKRVALNANARKSVLLELAPRFPMEVFGTPSFDALLLDEGIESFNLAPGLLARLLKGTGCPSSLLRWAERHGNAEEKLLVARHAHTPTDVLQRLAKNDGKVGAAARVLRLNDAQILCGAYPKILDLRRHELNTKIFMHLSSEFEAAQREGRLPQPNICISDSDIVETLCIPSDDSGIQYAVVENMPNLKEIYVSRGSNWNGTLYWLICRNLPSLEMIAVADGDLRWLQIEGMPSLTSIDVGNCQKLDYFSVRKAPKIQKIDIRKCKKLRRIDGLTPKALERLGIANQISAIQAKSKRNLKIYKGMTFTDLDLVLSNINIGTKEATRRCLLGDLDESELKSDFCYGRENDRKFDPFSYKLLRPLEWVYTGGTGELYPYEFNAHDFINGRYGIVSSEGDFEPEGCLEEALSYVDNFRIYVPKVHEASDKTTLEFLNKLAAEASIERRRRKSKDKVELQRRN